MYMKIIPQDIKQALYHIGFSRAEVHIIYHLFKNNLSSVTEMAKDTELPRSSIVYSLEELQRKNVISTQEHKNKKVYYIDKPETLIEYINKEEAIILEKYETLKNVLPSLKTMFSQWRDCEPVETEVLRGEDGLVECFMRGLDQPDGSEILRFGTDSRYFIRARDRLKDFHIKREAKNISVRLILPDNPHSEIEQSRAKLRSREVGLVNESIYNPTCQTAIWGDYVSFTAWDEGLETVIIKNSTIANLQRQLFEVLWSQARK